MSVIGSILLGLRKRIASALTKLWPSAVSLFWKFLGREKSNPTLPPVDDVASARTELSTGQSLTAQLEALQLRIGSLESELQRLERRQSADARLLDAVSSTLSQLASKVSLLEASGSSGRWPPNRPNRWSG